MLTMLLMIASLPIIAILAPYVVLLAFNKLPIIEKNGIGEKTTSSLLSFIILLIGFGTAFSTILYPRDLSMGEQFDEIADPSLAAFMLSRIVIAIIIALSCSIIFKSINQTGMPKGGSSIWFSYALFIVTSIFITSFAGTVPSFNMQLLYAPIVLTACYLSPLLSATYISLVGGILILFYAYGSIAAAVFAPDWAVSGNYEAFLPGIDFRLYGIAGHPNSLGPLMAVYFILEFIHPTQSKARIMHISVATIVFLLAQCKTAWLFILVISLIFLFRSAAKRLFPIPEAYNKCLNFVLVTMSLVIIIGGICVSTGFIQPFSYINLDSLDRGEEVTTLTGRVTVWAISLAAWKANPIFGYGIGLWDTDFRSFYGIDFAGHAHNQFIHTLASSGLIGLTGLLIYLLACLIAAIKVRKISYAPLLIFCAILTSCITETPLTNRGILSIYFFLHLLLFTLLTQALKQQEMLEIA